MVERESSAERVTLDRVVGVAGRLFAERGYRATTLDDVADALSLKKASLYHYIDTKQSLLQAIYDQILGRIAEQVLPLAELDLPADERLRRMVASHIDFVTAERSLLSVVFQEEYELPEKMKDIISHTKRRYEDGFETVIRQGQEQGVLRAGSARLKVLALLGMCNWMHTWYDPARYDRREIAGEFVQLLERGWLASDAPSRPAWPRPDSVDSALADSFSLLERIRDNTAALTSELSFAKERLEEGVMRSQNGDSR
ncbi:TetR/AcrR family transcriptional regulator [Nocardia australiensis]|uniref:TetR/AcrR family transcriptional regulator n=1 Tax=Nocardia australiensis TaxID=2887191 RepID=UPI001D14A354|nr:TetR/AcrR family transcriptional regulator [Nocardia australiensis]